jgi:hypothetical protein
LSTPTPHRFDYPIWPLRDVLGWVLDRDPVKFGRLFTEEDAKSALFRAFVYNTRWPRPERDLQAQTTLLHALQRGELLAYDGPDLVARGFWTDKTPQYIRDCSRFLFRREDVIALWPDPLAQTLRAPRSIWPQPTPKPTGTGNSEPKPSPPIEPPARGRPGRKIGSGTIDDTERLREMLRLLAAGQTHSVHAAADRVVGTMVGVGQSRIASVTRLRTKFARDHGTNPPAGETWADVADKLKLNWRQSDPE